MEGKTNWKYILIVLVLVVIAGGGIIIYQYWWTPKQETQIPEVKPPEEIAKDETTNWKTYQNVSYHLSLQYPPDWSIELIENQSYSLTFKGDEQGIIVARPSRGGKEARNYLNNIFISYREIPESFEEYIRPEFCDVGECSPVELDLEEEVMIDGRKGVLQVGDLGIAGKTIQSFIQMGGSRILAIYSSMGDPDQGLNSLEAKNQIQVFRTILNSIRFLE
jgi:hypothetical protein